MTYTKMHRLADGHTHSIQVMEGGIVHEYSRRPTPAERKEAWLCGLEALVESPRDLRESHRQAHARLEDSRTEYEA